MMVLKINNIEVKKKKINILFVSNHFNYFVNEDASFHRMYNNLIYFYKNTNFNVIVLQPDRLKNLEDKKLKLKIKCYYYRKIRCLEIFFTIFNDINPFYIFKLSKILRKERIHIIHVDFVFGINVLRFITKVPVIYNAHNVEYIFADQISKFTIKSKFLQSLYPKVIYIMEKRVLNFVKLANAISNADKKNFVKIYNVPETKILVNRTGYVKKIYNNPIPMEEARAKLGIEVNKFVIIYHGSFSGIDEKEAIDIIINKIAPKINDDNIVFLLAGRNLPKFKNTNNLKFLGFVKNLNEFLYSADIALIPLLRGSGIRIKIIDYLSAKIPIISTKKGAEGLILRDGQHGYIVQNSVDEMIQKILELKNNPLKIIELKKNIKKLLEEHYNWEKNLGILDKYYRKILS